MQFPTISGVKQCYVTGPRRFSLFHLAWFGHTMKNLREWIIRSSHWPMGCGHYPKSVDIAINSIGPGVRPGFECQFST